VDCARIDDKLQVEAKVFTITLTSGTLSTDVVNVMIVEVQSVAAIVVVFVEIRLIGVTTVTELTRLGELDNKVELLKTPNSEDATELDTSEELNDALGLGEPEISDNVEEFNGVKELDNGLVAV
jgi:hypothetical protein